LRVTVSFKISSAVLRRNYVLDPKSFRGARTCSRSSVTVPSVVWGSDFTVRRGEGKNVEFLSVVNLSGTSRSNDGVSAYDFAMKPSEYRNGFDTV